MILLSWTLAVALAYFLGRLSRERRISAAWKALADARAELAMSKALSADGKTPSAEALADIAHARKLLADLEIDPGAP